MVHYQYISPRLNKNVLRINPELVRLQVSGLQDCVEVSRDPIIFLGISFGSNFVKELAMKLCITLVRHHNVEGSVFVVNAKRAPIHPRTCRKWDLYFNDEMFLLEILVSIRTKRNV